MRHFVDTNVLVYARDPRSARKQTRADAWLRHLWGANAGRLSFQVLQEFYVTITRKFGVEPRTARAEVRDLLAWRPASIGADMIEDAWGIESRFRLSFWDALIVAGARATGCERLLTEDLNDGQVFDGVIVVDPFLHPPES